MERVVDLQRVNLGKPAGFRMWDYLCSHNQLNIRNARLHDDGSSSNIDLVFYGVAYMELPPTLADLQFDRPTGGEVDYLRGRYTSRHDTSCDPHTYYVLVSRSIRYYVVAEGLYMEQNDLPLEVSALDHIWGDSSSTE
jgi:hypothetical protein